MSLRDSVLQRKKGAQESSAQLLEMARQLDHRATEARTDLRVIDALVRSGADVCAKAESMDTTILSSFIRDGRVAVVNSCLGAQDSIDFTGVTSLHDKTPLHWACLPNLTDAETASMVELIVSRTTSHPKDSVDWSQRFCGDKDLVAVAAEHQKLSIVWPLIHHVGFYAKKRQSGERMHINGPLWAWDWKSLSREDQHHFDIAHAHLIEIDAPTARLVKVSQLDNPEPMEVQRLIEVDAANCLFREALMNFTALHQFFAKKNIPCAKMCLEAKKPLDFTKRDRDGFTPLHFICMGTNNDDDVAVLLNLVLDRLALHKADVVNWELRSKSGKDFLSLAAENAQLALVWFILKRRDARFLKEKQQKQIISCPVHVKDWEKLTPEDQANFDVSRGFI